MDSEDLLDSSSIATSDQGYAMNLIRPSNADHLLGFGVTEDDYAFATGVEVDFGDNATNWSRLPQIHDVKSL
jgi:hypothetical protein